MLNFGMNRKTLPQGRRGNGGRQTPAFAQPRGPQSYDAPVSWPSSPSASSSLPPSSSPVLSPATQDCDWWTQHLEQAFDEAAQAAGLRANQLDVLKQLFVQAVCEAEADEQAENDARKQDTLAALERAWGADADRQFAAANQAAMALALDAQALEQLMLTDNAVHLVQALAKLGAGMAEDGALPLGEDRRFVGQANASQDLARLEADKDHVAAYLNPAHPGHSAAKRQRQALIDQTLGRSGR